MSPDPAMATAIHVVLHEPQQGGNVGAVARALKNMGFSHLTLVGAAALDWDEARRLARGAEEILENARRVPTLDAALADCRWVVGTTRRPGRHRGARFTARDFAAAAASHRSRRPLGIVFGAERAGLGADDLSRCHDIVTIPSSPAQPSLNLAQAVLLVVYELGLALEQAQAMLEAPAAPAPAAALEGLFAHLEEALLAVGFVRDETVRHQMRVLRRTLGRAQLRPDEVTQWRGICRQILWAARQRDV